MSKKTSIAWLRNDLRVADNPALSKAAITGENVVALYIHEEHEALRAPGEAGQWWLHHSLMALGTELAERGVELVIGRGDPHVEVGKAAKTHGAGSVFWNRRYAPGERDVDTAVKDQLRAQGIEAESLPGNVLVEPWEIATGQGSPYSVFSPFWKTLRQMDIAQPLQRPARTDGVKQRKLDSGYKQPKWAGKLADHWTPGEAAAHRALDDFLERVSDYPEGRDYPARSATSRLSPHLRHGEISPRQIWHAAQALSHRDEGRRSALDKFLSELAWRDFNYHQLYHRPDVSRAAMRPKYDGMEWRKASDDLRAWQLGLTGLPVVDAGMRELWATGYMENRVRMLVASLLTKNLLIDWRDGEAWFWDCLVDGDVANNPCNWQWVAGSGLDASPYFRIFNPVTQGEQYDGDGDYVRRWVPELANLPEKWLHRPFDAPSGVLAKAGVSLGKSYPKPIVDLKASRERALAAVAAL
jgi:deoxyribodipyrimidine photo-lyase